MASPHKKFKTEAGKQHNTDLTEDVSNIRDYGWIGSFNQRALLVRMVCGDKEGRILKDLQDVKFITKDPNSHEGPGYKCRNMELSSASIDQFFSKVDKLVKGFEHSEIKSEHWKEIVNCMKLFDFKYEGLEVNGWKSTITEKFSKLSKGKRMYLAAFELAMKTDMKNGHGKTWLSALIQVFTECSDDFQALDIMYKEPAFYTNTNTEIELIIGDLDSLGTQILYNAPYTALPGTSPATSVSSASSSCVDIPAEGKNVTRCTVVPDFCVMLRHFPGMFPLVIEMRPAKTDSEGLNQNLKQMLSKMFFQDVVFGIVITPVEYILSVIIKKQGELHFARVLASLIDFKDGVEKLHIENLDILCTFIYHALKWGEKTKCLLEEPMPKQESVPQ